MGFYLGLIPGVFFFIPVIPSLVLLTTTYLGLSCRPRSLSILVEIRDNNQSFDIYELLGLQDRSTCVLVSYTQGDTSGVERVKSES